MCPVVLYRHQFEPVLPGNLAGKPGGEELGMEVMGDHVELCAKQPLEIAHGVLQVLKRRRVPDVADMRGGDGKPPFVDRRVGVQFRDLRQGCTVSRDRWPSSTGRSPGTTG